MQHTFKLNLNYTEFWTTDLSEIGTITVGGVLLPVYAKRNLCYLFSGCEVHASSCYKHVATKSYIRKRGLAVHKWEIISIVRFLAASVCRKGGVRFLFTAYVWYYFSKQLVSISISKGLVEGLESGPLFQSAILRNYPVEKKPRI